MTGVAVGEGFVQMDDLLALKGLVADAQHGAAQADRGCVFHGKGYSLGGGTEAPGTKGKGGLSIGTEVKFAWGIENIVMHRRLSAGIGPAGIGRTAPHGRASAFQRQATVATCQIDDKLQPAPKGEGGQDNEGVLLSLADSAAA